MEIKCAWCGLIMKEGIQPTSHSICENCVKVLTPDKYKSYEIGEWTILKG
jgi:hypothetical protein